MSYRGRNRRFRRNDNSRDDEEDSGQYSQEKSFSGRRGRGMSMKSGHPSHLKGREIGLYYRNLNHEKKKRDDDKNLQSISLPSEKIKEIRELLNLPNSSAVKSKTILNTLIYDERIQSKFKSEFLKIISTNFEAHLNQCLLTKEEEGGSRQDEYNEKLFLHMQNKSEQKLYIEMQEQRQRLPSFLAREKILDFIKKNQVILISGETGCGKTTQVPQFILDDAIKSMKGTKCKILCTQPRRISAITIAERVSLERNEKLGESVGYLIRLENKLPRTEGGNITYCTTGILLKKMEVDPSLNDISHLILDEIHERDVISDLSIGILKKILSQRKDLKVILMSATLRSNVFSEYFNNCPIVHIEGLTFPVESFYLEDVLEETKFFNFSSRNNKPIPIWVQKKNKTFNKFTNDVFSSFIEPYARSLRGNYSSRVIETIKNPESEKINIDLIEELIFHICMKKPPGAILVFLPGYDKISNLHKKMLSSNRYSDESFKIYPLHSMMPTVDQKNVFLAPKYGVRKIILATNIAETSITINDIVYVIDSGKRKITNYNIEQHIQTLDEEWVTTANLKQRRGRAGRVQSGICYHLFTRARGYTLEEFPLPEILRTRLESVILTIKILCLGDSSLFLSSLIDVPQTVVIEKSIEFLKRLNALYDNENLTPLGLHLGRLPLDPQTGKMILMGAIFSCIDPITSVAASLSFKDAFYCPIGKTHLVDQIKQEFAGDYRSDHLMLANVINQWRNVKQHSNDYKFCHDNFLSYTTLAQLAKMKTQFCENLTQSQFLYNSYPDSDDDNINSQNTKLIKGIICAGLYPNIAKITKIRIIRNHTQPVITAITPEDGKVKIHPSSVNATQRTFDSKFLTYYMKQKSTAIFLYDTTMVNAWPILFFGDMLEIGNVNNIDYISIGGHIKFNCNKETSDLIIDLRNGFEILLEKKICQPSPMEWNSDEGMLLKAIIHLITIDGKSEFSDDDEYDDDFGHGSKRNNYDDDDDDEDDY